MTPHRLLLAAALVLAFAAACQPTDEPELTSDDVEATAPSDPVGAPGTALADDLDTLLARLDSTATEWQSGAQASEIVVELGEAGEWTAAAVTYLAPDADRFLLLRIDADGTSQERPTLEGFELHPLPASALERVPAPDGLLEPAALVEAAEDVLDECAVEEPTTIAYATGAPAAWDGETWTEEPAWTAIVSGEQGALLDAHSGEPAAGDPCVAGA